MKAADVAKLMQIIVPDGMITEIDDLMERLDEDVVGVLGKWDAIEASLAKYGYVYDAPNQPVDVVLVSMDNRSKLMLNAIGAHERGARMKRVGVRIAELEKHTCAFEIPPCGNPRRDLELQKNMELANNSGGLLKPVTGQERLLSVGSSHATALFRAAFHGCKTTEPSLRGCDGTIDFDAWAKSQPAVAQIKQYGYSWRVVRWEVGALWPRMADIASRAHNGDQAVATGRGELEVCANIAAIADDAHKAGAKIEWQKIVAQATSVPAPCNAYADVLGTYARLYADGAGAPMLFQLEEQIKKHAPQRVLGEEMWRAIAYTNFGKFRPMAEVRNAMIGAALTSSADKIKNNIVGVLNPTDVSKIASKGMTPALDNVVTMLTKAHELISSSANPDAVELVHHLGWRLVLNMAGKGKHSFEATEFPSREACCRRFVEDCKNKLGLDMQVPEEWALPLAPVVSEPGRNDRAKKNDSICVATVADQSSPLWVHGQQGFVVDGVLLHIASKTLWTIISVDDTGCEFTLQKYVLFGDAPYAKADVATVSEYYRIHTGALQKAVDQSWTSTVTSRCRDSSKIDVTKAHIYMCLQKLEDEVDDVYTKLLKVENPHGLRANCKFSAKALTLVPAVPLRSISTVKSNASMCVSLGELLKPPLVKKPVDFFLTPYYGVPKLDQTESWACPYFWVETVHTQGEANMRLENVEVVVGDRALTVPVLKNFRAIKQFEKIAVFEPAKTKQTDEPVHVKPHEENDAAPKGGKGGKRSAEGEGPKSKKGR